MINKKVSNTREELEKEIEERKKLEEILEVVVDDVEVLTAEAEKIINKKTKDKLNYNELKEEVDSEANSLVKETALFFFSEEAIESERYLRERIKADILTISNLLFQMKTSEHAIVKLLELIDEGNVQPRQFEVLASLQKSKMEIVKHLASMITILETNYRNISTEYQFKSTDVSANVIDATYEREEDTKLVAFGTKDLIKTIRGVIDEKEKNKLNDG